MDFLPNNKYQLIGFVCFLVCQLITEFWLGRTSKTKASSILEALMLLTMTIASLFKREKKDGDKSSTP